MQMSEDLTYQLDTFSGTCSKKKNKTGGLNAHNTAQRYYGRADQVSDSCEA